jgi:transcription initiation factor TFIID subunit 5
MSPDYQYASFTSEDSSIYLHDLSTTNTSTSSSVKLSGGHSSTVLKSRFTHDSSYILSSDFDGLVCLWRMSNLDRHHHRHRHSSILPVVSYSGHSYPVWDLDPFSSLNLFATASKDATARLWSFDRLYPLRVYAGHHADVNCVRFHPNASYLATASSDKTVRMWSVQSCEFVRLFSGHRGRVFALAFSPDGNYLASAGEDRKVVPLAYLT